MPKQYDSALYSPYGAYEQKAKYQRNFLLGTGSVVALVVLILATAYIIAALGQEDLENIPKVVIKTVADLGPPPSVAKKPPQVQVTQPNVAAPRVGIPTPVADDEVLDEDVTIATRDELADIVAPDITELVDESGGQIEVAIDDDDYLPAPDEFIAVEIQPELIYKHKPDYPQFAQNAGLTGTVWVQVLVDEEGNVMRAQVAKSCGVKLLDEAAVEGAKKCTFKPAIQNGRPVKIWVSFPYEFQLRSGE
jgi:protein TonB